MQNKGRLPRELVTLVQHVELSDAAWWERAVQRFLVSAVWIHDSPVEAERLPQVVREHLGIDLDPGACEAQMLELCEEGRLVEVKGAVQLSLVARREMEQSLARTEETENSIRQRVATAFSRFEDVDEETAWELFDEVLVEPLIAELGVRVYEIVTGGAPPVESAVIRSFTQAFPSREEEALAVVVDVLDPNVAAVQDFLLSRLNAHFLVASAHPPEGFLERLRREDGSQRPTMTLFVDTNFLFSFLGLHENPSNEAASRLLELVEAVRDHIEVRLYVLPITIDETRRVINANVERLSGMRLGPRTAAAAVASVQPSGIVRRYLSAVGEHGGRLSADEFFGPYQNDLLTILRQYGLELYNASLDALRLDQAVIDDVLDQEEFQKEHRSYVKSYEANLHDVVLWHFVNGRRPHGVSSPLDVKYWALSVDFAGLLSFDRFKQTTSRAVLPHCIHPAALISVLQFFAPLDEALQRALVACCRLPLIRADVDEETERVTLKMLKALSRYENLEDLEAETIQSLLLSDALRSRISRAHSAEEEMAALDSMLIDELKVREKQLAHLLLKTGDADAHAASLEETVGRLQEESSQKSAEIEALRTEVQRAKEDATAKERVTREGSLRRRFLWAIVGVLLATGAVVAIAYVYLPESVARPWRWAAIGSAGSLVLGGGLRLAASGEDLNELAEWWPIRSSLWVAGSLGRLVRFVLVATAGTILGNLVTQANRLGGGG